MNRVKQWCSTISEKYSCIPYSNDCRYIEMDNSSFFKNKKKVDFLFKLRTQFQYHISESNKSNKIVKQYESLFLSL